MGLVPVASGTLGPVFVYRHHRICAFGQFALPLPLSLPLPLGLFSAGLSSLQVLPAVDNLPLVDGMLPGPGFGQ
jgi:hypothetical protein